MMRRWFAVFLMIVLAGVVIRQIQVENDSIYHGQRGPYLQKLSPTGVVIRWQTTQDTNTALQLNGVTVQNQQPPGKEHRLELQQLTPATQYRYRVIDSGNTSSGREHSFTTPPAFDSPPQAVRLWVLGDPGSEGELHQASRSAGQQWLQQNARPGRTLMDLWITTGDNAYTSGRNREFQASIFTPYESWLSRFNLIPVAGNHDIRRRAYMRIFDFPAAGELGGVASGSQHFYSLDQGPLHLVVLDTAWAIIHDRPAMLAWLKQDLQANTRPWVIAAFHHAPYSKGSHDSDDTGGSDRRIALVRKHVLPVLEQHDVDLVLTGHSHVYERSHLLNGHYGKSGTLTDAMIVSRGQGNNDLFNKAADCQNDCGTVYQVLGSTAELRPGAIDHPAMAVGLNQGGTVIIDVDQNCLHSRFLNSEGQLADAFMISTQNTCH